MDDRAGWDRNEDPAQLRSVVGWTSERILAKAVSPTSENSIPNSQRSSAVLGETQTTEPTAWIPSGHLGRLHLDQKPRAHGEQAIRPHLETALADVAPEHLMHPRDVARRLAAQLHQAGMALPGHALVTPSIRIRFAARHKYLKID